MRSRQNRRDGRRILDNDLWKFDTSVEQIRARVRFGLFIVAIAALVAIVAASSIYTLMQPLLHATSTLPVQR